METQDRYIELDRQTQTKVSQEAFCWKGAAITLVWCFQHPGSKCVWRVTGLSDHSLVSSHRGSSERKGRARPSLFLCSWVHSSAERKVYASPWLWPWAVLLFVGGMTFSGLALPPKCAMVDATKPPSSWLCFRQSRWELQNSGWSGDCLSAAWTLGRLPWLWMYQESGTIGTWRPCH